MAELALLRPFVEVARSGSFTRAAEALNTGQSVVSRAVQRLEDQLGVRLIARSTRTVSLTPAGQAFLADALVILERLAVAGDNARRIGSGAAATLRVGICPSTERPEVVRGIARFRAAWPDVQLLLQARRSIDQPDALRASDIDLGIMQSGGAGFHDLSWRTVTRHRVMVAVPTAWGHEPGSEIDLAALRDRPWIVPDRQTAPVWHDAFVTLCKLAGFEPQVGEIAEDAVTTRIKVACGMGATFLHDHGSVEIGDMIALLRFNGPSGLPLPPAESVVAWHVAAAASQVRDFAEALAGPAH